jgi:hypothetical protein
MSISNPLLSASQIEEFRDRGVLVIENVLSLNEINEARRGLYQGLSQRGIDVNTPTTLTHLSKYSTTHGAGGVLDIFYEGDLCTL